MTTTTAGQGGAPPLKGSWEARASEARALSLQGRDEAIEKFTFLIERLARMPEAQRLAQDQRLQTILEQSAIGLQSYYARRNRLDDMKTIDDRILGILGDVAQSICRESQARAYWWQGRHQVAAEIVGAEVEKMPFDVDLRWLLFSILIDDEKIDEADAVKVSLLDYLKSDRIQHAVFIFSSYVIDPFSVVSGIPHHSDNHIGPRIMDFRLFEDIACPGNQMGKPHD